MTADKQLKAYIDRVLRLKEDQYSLGDDIREIYAEAKAEGYDKTIMGKVVAHLRTELKKGAGAVAEAESIFDTYLSAYQRASGTVVANAHVHTHEEEFDPITGEFTTKSPRKAAEAVSERTAFLVGPETGLAEATIEGQPSATVALTVQHDGVNVGGPERAGVTAGETATQFHAKASDDACEAGRKTLGRAEASAEAPDGAELASRVVDGRTSTATSERMDVTGGESAATDPEIDPSEDSSEGHSLDVGNVGANVGGRHVDDHRSAATAGAWISAPAKKALRPHCRRPENCGGYGSTHCGSCLKASTKEEVAA